MYELLLQIETDLNLFIQKTLHIAEPLWILLSEHFTAAKIIDIYIPIIGIFHHQLMVRLVCSLGVMNALNSLIKWCSPEYRPYWWTRELDEKSKKNSSSAIELRQFPQTCETTAGFPSSHSMCFTTFIYLMCIFTFVAICRKFRCSDKYVDKITFLFVSIASFCMWISRMYLASQFLHQCMLGSMGALTLLHFFDQHADYLYTLTRFKAVTAVIIAATLPIVIYFSMLRMSLDPHWSVRMAFKWCADPSYLRHEASPIFLLGRDFGFLLGVALSAPLYKRYECGNSLKKRLFFIITLESLNYYARLETPKHLGRVAFVGYESCRNLMHSYSLLTILSKIC